MKKASQPSSLFSKYSVIEIALAGHGLRAKEKEAAHAFLAGCRIPERSFIISDYKGAFRLACYTRSPKKVREVRKRYRLSGKPPFALKVKSLKRGDWFDKWKRDYHIKPLGAKFMIVPIWEKRKFKLMHGSVNCCRNSPSIPLCKRGRKTRSNPGVKLRRIPVFLEPGSAFGSGYHETTRLMTRLLEGLGRKTGSFLDVGCGTGILSVVASKLGAGRVVGFDHDRPSALVAKKNFSANACKQGTFFCAQLKGAKVSGHFDVVGANLLSRLLLEHRVRIAQHVRPGGSLLVSGIATENFAAFRREFLVPGLKCLKVLRGRRWVGAVYRKKNHSF